jgi:hypothetical protein
MTTISWLMLFKEIVDVYFENDTKSINTLCGQNEELLNVKVGSTKTKHCLMFLVRVTPSFRCYR